VPQCEALAVGNLLLVITDVILLVLLVRRS
jgi:hypothetical protein